MLLHWKSFIKMDSTLSTLLYEYLIRTKKLPIASLGTLELRTKPPSFDTHFGIFFPRKYYYAFFSDVSESEEARLKDYVAERLNISFKEALRALQLWSSTLWKYAISTKYEWEGVGTFYRVENDNIVFETWKEYVTFTSDIPVVHRIAGVAQGAQSFSTSYFTDTNYEKEDLESFSLPQPSSETGLPGGSSTTVQTAHTELESKVESGKVYTEFVELDAPERYTSVEKILIILFLLLGLFFIFVHLFLNDFSFHSYVE